MAKFKKGDRVRNTHTRHRYVPFGAVGTVMENGSQIPFVDWDNVGVKSQIEDYIELITDPITESSSPTPEMGPVEGTIEWWRWHFAGHVIQGCLSANKELSGTDAKAFSVKVADALIAELKGGVK